MKIWIDCIRRESLVYSNLIILVDNSTSSPDENTPDVTTPQETNDHNESTCRWGAQILINLLKITKSKQVIRTNELLFYHCLCVLYFKDIILFSGQNGKNACQIFVLYFNLYCFYSTETLEDWTSAASV